MGNQHPPSWRIVSFALSAAGAMLLAINGVLIKLIYRYGIDTTRLLAMRMVLALPVFALVGAHRWRRLEENARPNARTVGLAMLVGVVGYYVTSWLDFQGLQTLDAQIERLILFGRLLLGQCTRRDEGQRHARLRDRALGRGAGGPPSPTDPRTPSGDRGNR